MNKKTYKKYIQEKRKRDKEFYARRKAEYNEKELQQAEQLILSTVRNNSKKQELKCTENNNY